MTHKQRNIVMESPSVNNIIAIILSDHTATHYSINY